MMSNNLMNNKQKRLNHFFFIILSLGYIYSFGYNTTVRTGDSDAVAKQELIRVFNEGGQIIFEEGIWTINLNNSQAKIKKDVTFIGANILGTANTPGAYETPASNLKTTVIFNGARLSVQKGCTLITTRNIGLHGRAFIAVNKHQVEVDFENTVFDLTTAPRSFLDRQVFRSPDGVQGKVTHCSFRGYERGIVSNRSVSPTVRPNAKREKIIVDWCRFIPDPVYASQLPEAFIIDAGNDESPEIWDQSGTTIQNCYIENSRIACSKGQNLNIINNTFFVEEFPKEPVHIEEFSQHILIKDNDFVFRGTKNNRLTITLGAVQSSNDIIIEGNTVDQNTDLIKSFIIGMAFNNITINNNTILNDVSNREYISFWGCGHKNIVIGSGQQGLSPSQVSIDTRDCPRPLTIDGRYTVKWSDNLYLGNVGGTPRLVTKTSVPNNDDNFLWDIIFWEDDATTMGNFYTFRNIATGKYLQVYKGPNAQQSKSQRGNRFENGRDFSDATFQFDFDLSKSRPHGWSLNKKNDKFLMSPGFNEHKSDLRRVGNTNIASLYAIENRDTGAFEWSFQRHGDADNPLSVVSFNTVNEAQHDITIFPNPVRDFISIQTPYPQNCSFTIYNQLGKPVMEKETINETPIYIGDLSKGIYFLELKSEKKKPIVKKLIIE